MITFNTRQATQAVDAPPPQSQRFGAAGEKLSHSLDSLVNRDKIAKTKVNLSFQLLIVGSGLPDRMRTRLSQH
jgi:hypothetical protein